MQAQQPDVVLLDLLMPRVDGLTACQRIRAFSAVPIIILTAWGAKQERIHGFDLGADGYLNKPFDIDELLARLRAILRQSQLFAHPSPEIWQWASRIGDLTIHDARHE
jgi:DNA-binding response OmpR family regulator